MKKLNQLLKVNGIKEVEHNFLDDKFNSPMDQLDDLFKDFGRIFGDYGKNISETKLNSGAVVKIRNNQGRIFVDSPMRLHKEYSETFLPFNHSRNK